LLYWWSTLARWSCYSILAVNTRKTLLSSKTADSLSTW
jgi:hypothetical protein